MVKKQSETLPKNTINLPDSNYPLTLRKFLTMKKLAFILVTGLWLGSCNGPDKKTDENQAANNSPKTSRNSDSFNQSFEKILSSYNELRDALVDYDTVKANAASKKLEQYADSLMINEITNDSTGAIKETAKNYTETIKGSALGLIGETDLVKKKREFQMISDAMYDLVRTVKYDKQKLYHQHCPMAFNDEEDAYWLSNNREIVNPYLGKQHPKYKAGMLHCGETTDSLDFSQ